MPKLLESQPFSCLDGCHCGSVRFRVSIDRCLDDGAKRAHSRLGLPLADSAAKQRPVSRRDFASERSCGSHRLVADDCNCSICRKSRKKGFLHLIVSRANFELLQGRDYLTIYTSNTKVAQHTFCSVCGLHAFYIPRSHPDTIDVNVRCLDRDITDMLTIRAFDGQNWEDNIAQIRD